nr:TolC family protein [uncultured Dethiosulfovibrio sp.]
MDSKKATCVLAAVVTLLWAIPALAVDLTLQEAVQTALDKDIDVLKALEDRKKSDAAKIVAKSALLPSLNLGFNYTRKDGNYALAGQRDAYGASLTATQPLYTGGKATALLRQSQAYEVSVVQSVENQKEAVALVVIRQFSSILHLRENVAAARDSLSFAENHLKEVVKKEALGVANRFEVTRAEQQMSSYRTQLIAAENGLQSAKIALLTTLRLDPHSEIEFQGELKYTMYSGDRQDSLARAMTNRNDLRAAIASLSVQKDEIQVAASGLRPKVDLKASYTWDDPKAANGDEDDDWKIALEVDIPLLDRNETKGKIIQQKAIYRQQELELERLKEAIVSDVAQAWLDLETAGETVNSTSLDLQLASESLRLSQVGYREGVSSQIDVLDAQASYTKARQEHAAALSDYAVKVATLKRIEGELVPFIMTFGGDIS